MKSCILFFTNEIQYWIKEPGFMNSKTLKTVTPAWYLQGLCITEISDLELIEKTNTLKWWQCIHRVEEDVKERLEKEYLGTFYAEILNAMTKLKMEM